MTTKRTEAAAVAELAPRTAAGVANEMRELAAKRAELLARRDKVGAVVQALEANLAEAQFAAEVRGDPSATRRSTQLDGQLADVHRDHRNVLLLLERVDQELAALAHEVETRAREEWNVAQQQKCEAAKALGRQTEGELRQFLTTTRALMAAMGELNPHGLGRRPLDQILEVVAAAAIAELPGAIMHHELRALMQDVHHHLTFEQLAAYADTRGRKGDD